MHIWDEAVAVAEILFQHSCEKAEQNILWSVGTESRQNFVLNTSCIFLHINQRCFYLEYTYVSSNIVRNIADEKTVYRNQPVPNFTSDKKNLDRYLTDQHVSMLCSYENTMRINFCEYHILTTCVFSTQLSLVRLESQFNELCGLRQISVLWAIYLTNLSTLSSGQRPNCCFLCFQYNRLCKKLHCCKNLKGETGNLLDLFVLLSTSVDFNAINFKQTLLLDATSKGLIVSNHCYSSRVLYIARNGVFLLFSLCREDS
jgi:hypothetical protein